MARIITDNVCAGLRPGSAALFRLAAVADNIPLGGGKGTVSVQPGDLIFNSFKNAHLNVRPLAPAFPAEYI